MSQPLRQTVVPFPAGRYSLAVMATGASIRPDLPDLRSFKDAVHDDFRVDRGDGERVNMALIGVVERDGGPGWEQFSLLFRGPLAPPHWQRTCTVEHADLGAFELFLVAIVTDGDGQHYEATFNRRRA